MGVSPTRLEPADSSRAYVRARLEALETLVADRLLQLDQARVTDPLRGVRITAKELHEELQSGPRTNDSDVPALAEHLAASVIAVLDDVPPAEQPQLHRLVRRLHLDDVDVFLLLTAAAPELDRRFERFYGFLNDDVSLRRVTVGLALELAGLPRDDPGARSRLRRGGRLHRLGLIEVPLAERPALSQTVLVPERVVQHVLGGGDLDPDVQPVLRPRRPDPGRADLALVGALRAGAHLVYCRSGTGTDGIADACDAVAAVGGVALPVELPGGDDADLVRRVVRESVLSGAVPVVQLAADVPAALLRRHLDALLAVPWCVIVVGTGQWDPNWSEVLPVHHEARRLTWSDRLATWSDALSGVDHEVGDVAVAAGAFRLTAHQIRRVTVAAQQRARLAGRAVGAEDLRDHARAQNSVALDRIAARVHPRACWDDLVLRHDQLERLREVEVRARHADLVLNQWGMGAGTRRRGIIALFAGPPGTGKTMAAEVVGGALGLDLYVINLATVIDKYIGETEKNLERVFEAATGVNGILFFDEADALFGKRSEIKDARDRYANVETAYLLQRLERFEGAAILATNLRANLDEAFSRRIDVFVDFPMPEADERQRIWRAALTRSLPVGDDIDLDFLARAFEFGGGNIVNVVTTAAFMAAERGGTVAMDDLIRATGREYRKLGRLCTKAEFGPHLHLAEAG